MRKKIIRKYEGVRKNMQCIKYDKKVTNNEIIDTSSPLIY